MVLRKNANAEPNHKITACLSGINRKDGGVETRYGMPNV